VSGATREHPRGHSLWQYALLRMLDPMEVLDARDASALLAFVGDLSELDDPLPFPPRVLEAMRMLIPSDSVGYSVLDPSQQLPVLQVASGLCGEDVVWGTDDPSWDEVGALWWKLRADHPVCGYRTATGDWTRPLKVSDFATLREFRRTPIYDTFYRGEIDYWLDVGLPATPTRNRVFIFTRQSGADYAEHDRLVLTLLCPHLERRAEEAETAASATSALAALEDGATDSMLPVVLCSRHGVIEFASPSARSLLARYLGIENGRLPLGLLGSSLQVFADGDRRLTIRTARTGALLVLLLDERDARLERLTRREREILESVARGRTNIQVAFELGIADATVAKHLEHVYEKLGVRTRTAAAARLRNAAGNNQKVA
jgi:DNA-binding CsgD family transcriptional regulator